MATRMQTQSTFPTVLAFAILAIGAAVTDWMYGAVHLAAAIAAGVICVGLASIGADDGLGEERSEEDADR